jgi:hypothetical protein
VDLLRRVLRVVWWEPILALCALLLGRFMLPSRAYCVVFGHNWIVIHNGGYCRLYLAPHRRAR